MASEVRFTRNVAEVLRMFLDDVDESRYGFELMQLTGLPSGTLYPVLARLEGAGWLVSDWEDVDPAEAQRPARRFYRITGEGARVARLELAALSARLRPPVPVRGRLRPESGPA
jgi:DNA-binding PadR family transcriptional regulator